MHKLNTFKIDKNFYLYEFQCPCCKQVKLDERLVRRLQTLRDKISQKLFINSGYRCPEENKKVKGDPNSFHLYGMAADVRAEVMDLRALAIAAEIIGFKGIGIYEAMGFCHLDIREEKKHWEGDY